MDMPLTYIAIRNTKPGPKPIKIADGGGLFLYVTPVFVEIETYRPDVARLQGTLGPHIASCIPVTPFIHRRVEV